MPVIAISSPKGGVGKTTAATIFATILAESGAPVIVIDADPNKNVLGWAQRPRCPTNLIVLPADKEDTIVAQIDAAQEKASFVIIDLEGVASLIGGQLCDLAGGLCRDPGPRLAARCRAGRAPGQAYPRPGADRGQGDSLRRPVHAPPIQPFSREPSDLSRSDSPRPSSDVRGQAL